MITSIWGRQVDLKKKSFKYRKKLTWEIVIESLSKPEETFTKSGRHEQIGVLRRT